MDTSHVCVDKEIELLKSKILELGVEQKDGKIGIEFGKLYDQTVDIFEVGRSCLLYGHS